MQIQLKLQSTLQYKASNKIKSNHNVFHTKIYCTKIRIYLALLSVISLVTGVRRDSKTLLCSSKNSFRLV